MSDIFGECCSKCEDLSARKSESHEFWLLRVKHLWEDSENVESYIIMTLSVESSGLRESGHIMMILSSFSFPFFLLWSVSSHPCKVKIR